MSFNKRLSAAQEISQLSFPPVISYGISHNAMQLATDLKSCRKEEELPK